MSTVLAVAPDAWSEVALSDVAQLLRGVSYPKTDARDDPAPDHVAVLRATNIQEGRLVLETDLVYVAAHNVSEGQRLREGDIVVATSSGSKHLVGKSALLRHSWSGSFGAFCAALRPKESINPRYLAAFLQSPAYWQQVSKKALGVNINNLRRGDLETLSLRLPPLEVQEGIVAEIEKQFSRLDEAVANLKRVKANLKRYKDAVLKAAVEGRLVPTEAELARREGRSCETGAQLLQRILETRRSQWKGKGQHKEPAAPEVAELPELPEGWAWATVEHLSSLVEYGSSEKTSEASTGIPVLRMGNIVEGELVFDDLKYLPNEYKEFPKLFLVPGDLLFNRTNSPELVGKTAVFTGTPTLCSFASYLIRVRPAIGCASKLLAAYINSWHGRKWVKSVVTQQVGQANVNGTKLQALNVPLPPESEQQRIVAEMDRRLSLVREVEAEVQTNLTRAERLRQGTLSQVFGSKSFFTQVPL